MQHNAFQSVMFIPVDSGLLGERSVVLEHNSPNVHVRWPHVSAYTEDCETS